MSHHQPERIPPLLLFGAGALMAASVIGVGVARIADIGRQDAPELSVVESVTVLFKDEIDGGVGVYGYPDGTQIHVFAPETGGFVRTAMRAVAHTRKLKGGGPNDAPFKLARTGEGRLLLTDTLTGKTISLEAFGDSNAEDFEQLLENSDGGV